MPRRITTRAQVSGYRFGLARAEHAIVRRDVAMVHDPMRTHSRALLVGAVLAVLGLAGAGLYGLIRPAPSVGDARIVTEGGALFVLVDGTAHPVLNVTSARLIVGSPSPVKVVSARSLNAYPRGATLGIVGAPSALPGPVRVGASQWTVCDGPGQATAVIAGELTGQPVPQDQAMLVRHGAGTWLLYSDGSIPVRARLDPADPDVVRALGADGATPRPISAALLRSFPERPELRVPTIPRRGERGLLDTPVGSVISTVTVQGKPVYRVVLAEGVQQIPQSAAEVLRAADVAGGGRITEVPPGALTRIRTVSVLDVAHFPQAIPQFRPDSPVLCRSWSRGDEASSATESMIAVDAVPVADQNSGVALGTADGSGPSVDVVYLRAGTAEDVVVTGSVPDSALASQRFVITDAGVRHRIVDAETAGALGRTATPPRAPWSVIALLPAGPALSRTDAVRTHSGVDLATGVSPR